MWLRGACRSTSRRRIRVVGHCGLHGRQDTFETCEDMPRFRREEALAFAGREMGPGHYNGFWSPARGARAGRRGRCFLARQQGDR